MIHLSPSSMGTSKSTPQTHLSLSLSSHALINLGTQIGKILKTK